jgi:hypothetical protein
MEELWNGHHDYGWPHRHLQTWDPEDKDTPGGNYRSGSLQQPAAIESVFDDFTGNPKLVGAMEALLDGPVKRYTDQTIFKPGVYKAGRSFYHQDSFYWKLRPKVCLNCWIALDQVAPDAIALGFLPGTHASWRIRFHELYWDQVPAFGRDGAQYQRKRIALDAVDDSREDLISGGPGDAYFFTNYTWHRGEPNLSGVNRAAYAIAYQLDRDDNLLSEDEFDALMERRQPADGRRVRGADRRSTVAPPIRRRGRRLYTRPVRAKEGLDGHRRTQAAARSGRLLRRPRVAHRSRNQAGARAHGGALGRLPRLRVAAPAPADLGSGGQGHPRRQLPFRLAAATGRDRIGVRRLHRGAPQ